MRIRSSARTRIVLTIALLLTFSAAVSTLALRQILLARVDDRIEAGLAQEVSEFRRLAAQTELTDVQRLFDQFLSRDIPDEGEASFTFVGDGLRDALDPRRTQHPRRDPRQPPADDPRARRVGAA